MPGLLARLRDLVPSGRSSVVRQHPIRVPEQVLDMDPWTRWCLAEPPAPAHGPWTGADVTWIDALVDPRVIRTALALDPTVWGTRGSDRALARQVGVRLLPEQVRQCRDRGIQGTDFPAHLMRDTVSYVAAIDRVTQSPSARLIIDPGRMMQSIRLLDGDLGSAKTFQRHHLKPLAVGLFAAWWDDHGRASYGMRRAQQLPPAG